MIVELSSFMGAVDRVRDLISDSKNENASILFRIDTQNSKMLVAHADGHKAVCSELDIQLDEGEAIENEIVAPFKQVSDAVDVIKPAGVIQVDDVKITLDTEKKLISFEAEKYINMADDENAEETSRTIISVMSRSFTYTRMEDDKRQRILTCVDYTKMLQADEVADIDSTEANIPTADSWNRSEFIATLQKMTVEDSMVIISGKNKNVRVAYTSYAVSVKKDEIKNSVCIPVKTAKTVMAVIKHCGSENIELKVEDTTATIRTDDGRVAVWFETAKPMSRVINILNAYGSNEYDKHQLVLIRDAIVNQVKCLGDDVNNVELTFTGDAVEGYKMFVGGGSSTTKTNKFSIALSAATGDNDGLLEKKFVVNSDVLKSMLDLCGGTFVGIEFGTVGEDTGSWALRVCEISKNAGVIERDTECYTMITATNK